MMSRRSAHSPGSGFTLVELLVVILIVAILAAIGIPSLLGARNSAYNGEARADIATAITAVRSSSDANDRFPTVDEITASEPTIPWQQSLVPDVGKIGVQRVNDTTVLLIARSKGDLAMLCTVSSRVAHICEESEKESAPVSPRDPENDNPEIPVDRYINLLHNPSFEHASVGTGYVFAICGPTKIRDGVMRDCHARGGQWAPAVTASTDAQVGPTSMEVTSVPIDPQDVFYVQSEARELPGITSRKFYARTKIKFLADAGTHMVRLQCRWDKPDGTFLAERDLDIKPVTVAQGWVDFAGFCAESNIPEGAGFMRWAIRISNNNGHPVTFHFRVDAAMLAANAGSIAVPYFDGDTPGARWTGATHNSLSEKPRL